MGQARGIILGDRTTFHPGFVVKVQRLDKQNYILSPPPETVLWTNMRLQNMLNLIFVSLNLWTFNSVPKPKPNKPEWIVLACWFHISQIFQYSPLTNDVLWQGSAHPLWGNQVHSVSCFCHCFCLLLTVFLMLQSSLSRPPPIERLQNVLSIMRKFVSGYL